MVTVFGMRWPFSRPLLTVLRVFRVTVPGMVRGVWCDSASTLAFVVGDPEGQSIDYSLSMAPGVWSDAWLSKHYSPGGSECVLLFAPL